MHVYSSQERKAVNSGTGVSGRRAWVYLGLLCSKRVHSPRVDVDLANVDTNLKGFLGLVN